MGDNLPAVDLGAGKTAYAITAGPVHACAILDGGSVKCWGKNNFGQLGLGDTNDRGDGPNEMGDSLPAVDLGNGRTATAITAGNHHVCALLDDASVMCWGANSSGQLGLGDKESRGDGANEMGAALRVDLGNGVTAKSVTAGSAHSCALLSDNSVKCWGDNAVGKLGLGDTNDRGDEANEMGVTLPSIDLGSGTVVAIGIGYEHTCALFVDGSLKCWGFNSGGQLGLGDAQSRGDGANEMGGNLPSVLLGTNRTAVAVAAGESHTCAVLDDATLKCWGSSWSGQLGYESTSSIGAASNQMGDNLVIVNLGNPLFISDGTRSVSQPPANAPADVPTASPVAPSAPIVTTTTSTTVAPTTSTIGNNATSVSNVDVEMLPETGNRVALRMWLSALVVTAGLLLVSLRRRARHQL